jgi:hypothetical protein
MDGRTGTAAAGPVNSVPAARTASLAPAGERQWPGMRPWPLFSALGPVAALPAAPGLARTFTAMVLGGWDLARAGDLGETSALVVSELATNVVRVAAGGDGTLLHQDGDGRTELWLRLMSDRALLRIEVWDNLPATAGLPSVRHPGAEDEHGRGLALVARLSHRWGCHQIPALHAKSVWALLKTR